MPSTIYEAPPQYPFELRKAGITGTATIDFIVNTYGNLMNAYAISATRPEFGEAAVAADSRWKFTPGMRRGVPVNCRLQIPISFDLRLDSAPITSSKK